MPFEWMECHREMYPTYHCNQAEFDHMNGRDPKANPYQDEWWYRKSIGWRVSEDQFKFDDSQQFFDALEKTSAVTIQLAASLAVALSALAFIV